MRKYTFLRGSLASLLTGGTLMMSGCGDLVRDSIKDGFFSYLTGSVSSTFDSALFGDFISNILTGGFMGMPDGGGESGR